jgi:predicted DNA-binding protein YlxM (UPF0122 family)
MSHPESSQHHQHRPPAIDTPDEDIRASTPEEFADLLRLLRVRSGNGSSEIAKRSNIARSQVYELIKQGRTSLPTRANQIVAFAQACGLPHDKIDILTALWAELAQPQAHDETEAAQEIAPSARPHVSTLLCWALAGVLALAAILLLLLVSGATTAKELVATTGTVLLPVIVILVATAFLIPITRAFSVLSNIGVRYVPPRTGGRSWYRLAVRKPRKTDD